jgi:hypothetical protein
MPNPQNLKIQQDTVLDENPPSHLVPAFQQVRIAKLDDLVSLGVISSKAQLEKLLDSAKAVTSDTLGRRETFTPFVAIPGTRQPDLRRFGPFLGANVDVHPAEIHTFWRVVREVEPNQVATLKTNTPLTEVTKPGTYWHDPPAYIGYLFQDVTVEAGNVLTFGAAVHKLECRNLLIQKRARIVLKNVSFAISAFSIQGIQ